MSNRGILFLAILIVFAAVCATRLVKKHDVQSIGDQVFQAQTMQAEAKYRALKMLSGN